ncbi:MAG TPA: prolipoprotein diacylglyceryl transferase [Xanthobacteraceae bacterium]|nr:prolipoprotein diacylglyceryl transferase [Xanthobacteraceae bacterium]
MAGERRQIEQQVDQQVEQPSFTMDLFVIPYPVIDPVAVNIGPFPIRWYALAYIGGLAGGWLYALLLVRSARLWDDTPRPTADTIGDLVLYSALAIVIGGRLGQVVFYEWSHYSAHPLEIFQLWQGGMSFHGGMIAAVLAMWYVAKQAKIPILTIGDICAVTAPTGIFFGRVANFIRPELWGRPTNVPWAMIFPDVDDQPRHPSQLYEGALEGLLLLFILGICVHFGALKRPGLASGIFCVGYGVARIFSEFFREPDPQLERLSDNLTMGMVLSAPLVVLGVGLIIYAVRNRRGTVSAESAQPHAN